MIAHLSQLHQHVHNGEEVGIDQSVLRPIIVDVLVVEKALASTQITLDDVLDLLRELLLNIAFHSSQKEGPQDRLQLLHNADIERLVLVDTLTERIGKPLFEVLLVAENLRHQEVH